MTPDQLEARTQAEKLKVILARALQKDARGVPLTPSEENLIAEMYRRKYENPRERVYVDNNGVVHVNKTIDAEPVMDAMKAYGDFVDRYTAKKYSQRMVGSIDPVTAMNWMKESGFKIGTKQFAKFAMKRIKQDIDYRRFRVGG